MTHEFSNTTIDRLIEESRDYDAKKTDYNDSYEPEFVAGKVYMRQDSDFMGVGPHGITDHALYQVCSKFGPGTFGKGSAKMLPFDALRQWLDNPQFAAHASAILNDHVDALKPKLFTRAYDNDIRAVLSDRYAPIDNTTILEMVRDAIGMLEKQASKPIKVEVYHSNVTPDDLYLRYRILGADILPPGETGPYAFGGLITNGETGKVRIKMLPTIFRGPCTNTQAFDDGNDMAVNMRHYGQAQIMNDRVALAIGSSIKLGQVYLNKLIAAKEVQIPDIFGVISKMAESEGWSVEVTDAVRSGTEGQHNLWGFINGLTYAAHTQFADSQEKMTDMEMQAGAWLLNPPKVIKNAVAVPAVALED